MTHFAAHALPVLALVSLTACGGGGSSSSQTSYIDMLKLGDAIAARRETVVATRPLAMPTTGRATYDGVALFAVGPDAFNAPNEAYDTAGEVEMRADFRSGLVDGEIGNFQHRTDGALDGKLDMSFGRISGNLVTGTLVGDMEVRGRKRSVIADLLGGFSGSNAEGLSGIIAGDTSNRNEVSGVFVTER